MSRKVKRTEICADCGATEAGWASVNTGLLICDDCCSVHRTLGRQVSLVKSLKKSIWSPTELQMIRDLYVTGSNTIFEHNLGETTNSSFAAALTNTIKSNRRKPSAKDPLHPTKEDFIRSKYQNLAFINRFHVTEETQTDINEQLHSSVRTSNLKTSLRLLVSGANPNYLHPEKGNTPLIVATKAGYISQVELLIVYGADPLICDVRGKTAFDYATEGEHDDIAQRLIECQYELTDRLSYFLCGRRPDHLSDQHFVVPEMSDSIDVSDLAKDAKSKLQSLPNRVFQEIAKDVYDEVDRREINEICLSFCSQGTLSNDHQSVPFLPVTPQFSAIRNQGRQKLARYNAREFATLVIDILTESRRRQLCSNESVCIQNKHQSTSKPILSKRESDEDSEPVYDSVASDDDTDSDDKSEQRLLPEKDQRNNSVLVNKFTVSESVILELVESNKVMEQEISRLHSMIQKLVDDNVYNRSYSNAKCLRAVSSTPPPVLPRCPKNSFTRPQSMFEKVAQSNAAPPNQRTVIARDDSGIESSSSSNRLSRGQQISSEHLNKSEILRYTELITRSIQELLSVALENKVELFVGCSENILLSVKDMISLFPEASNDGEDSPTRALTEKLYYSAFTLCSHCKVDCSVTADKKHLAQQVIQCAYDVAKAAKELVTNVIN